MIAERRSPRSSVSFSLLIPAGRHDRGRARHDKETDMKTGPTSVSMSYRPAPITSPTPSGPGGARGPSGRLRTGEEEPREGETDGDGEPRKGAVSLTVCPSRSLTVHSPSVHSPIPSSLRVRSLGGPGDGMGSERVVNGGRKEPRTGTLSQGYLLPSL